MPVNAARRRVTQVPVQEFYRARLEKAVKEIEETRVTGGMRIWKLYNHGFFVRTPTVAFTFDIVPGLRRVEGFRVDKQLLERIAEQSDATFVSHLHGDHANREVARIFLARGKPVVAVEGLWSDEEKLANQLTFPGRSTTVPNKCQRTTLNPTESNSPTFREGRQ